MTMKSFKSGEFAEAVAFFKDKIKLPTATWKDLQGEMHAKAFTVAGAMREDILCDLHKAVEKAITDGMSIQEFRKDFDSIVKRTGWQYNGTRNWRSDLIYQTNLHTAYAAGREKQMRDPKMRKIYPYARYRSMDDGRERPEHKAWNNIVLPLNDPWWDKHTPPNGWNCRCWKEPVSALEVKALGLEIAGEPPTSPDDKTGIDKGWDYNVGDAAYGNERIKEEYKRLDQKIPWKERDQDGLWQPNSEEYVALPTITGPEYHSGKEKLKSKEAFVEAIKKGIGGETKAIVVEGPAGVPLTFNVDAQYLVDHLVDRVDGKGKMYNDFSRSRYVAMICKTINDPTEIRIGFLRSATGKIAIRSFFYSKYDNNGKTTLTKVVFDSRCASFVGYTTYASTGKIALEGVRVFRKGLK